MPPIQMPFLCLGICLPYEFWWREEIVEAESAESWFPDVPVAKHWTPDLASSKSVVLNQGQFCPQESCGNVSRPLMVMIRRERAIGIWYGEDRSAANIL